MESDRNESTSDAPASQSPPILSYRRPEARWIKLGEYSSLEAELIRNKLDDYGIPCLLSGQATAGVYAGLGPFGVRVEVPEDQVEHARELLKKPHQGGDETAPEEDYVDEDWRCPKCHRKNVRVLPMRPWQLLFCLATIFLAFPFISKSRLCQDCGHRWRS